MKRLVLFLLLLLLFVGLVLWLYRKDAAEAALSWALSVFSPTRVEFEITGFEPPQIAFRQITFPEIGLKINNPVLEVAAYQLRLQQGAKFEYQQPSFMLRGLFQDPWLLQRRSDSSGVDFKQTKLDLSGSSYTSPAFVLTCAACALRVDQGVFSSAGLELQGALELKKIKTSLALEGKEDFFRNIFIEGKVNGGPAVLNFEIKKLKASVLGGSLARAKETIANVPANCFSIPLAAKDIEIPKILELYPTSQVSASGSLSGSIPIIYCKNNWRIENAALKSSAGGNIKLTAPIASGNEQLDFAFQALRDFDYSTLRATLSMQSNGKIEVSFNIEGISRSLNKNRHLVVNLNVEENLWELLKSLKIAQKVNESFSRGAAAK